MQWRIQDFPDGEGQAREMCANILFDNIFAENCMKMKEIGPRGGSVSNLIFSIYLSDQLLCHAQKYSCKI